MLPSTSASSKRSRKVLSIKEKVDIINQLQKGVSAKNLSVKYGVGQQTVYDIKKRKTEILKFFSASDSIKGLSVRKTLKGAEHEQVDLATYEWFRQQRFRGLPISGAMIIEKAQHFHAAFKIETTCHYSQGWLGNFKSRHGIHSLKASGEKMAADYESATLFVEELDDLIKSEKLTLHQIYNADETGIFWKALPRRTLVSSNESSVEGVKESKERLTALMCANASGTHKCNLLVIGKNARPRAFKNIKQLPVLYMANKKAWVTQELFLKWFDNHFVAEARKSCKDLGLGKDCKILLLLDNCPAHPDVAKFQSNNIIVKYLPPNCTSLIQPMDQGVIRSCKCHYRKGMVRKLINLQTEGDVTSFIKNFNLKHAIWSLSRAWSDVTEAVLKSSWGSILYENDNETSEYLDYEAANIEDTLIDELNQGIMSKMNRDEFVNWVDSDIEAPTFATLTDAEIVEGVLNPKENQEELSSDDDVDEELVLNVKTDDAIIACETLLNYLENHDIDEIIVQDKIHVHRIQANLIEHRRKSQRQTKVNEFFSKI